MNPALNLAPVSPATGNIFERVLFPGQCFQESLIVIIRNGLVLFLIIVFIGIILAVVTAGLRVAASQGNSDEYEKGFDTFRNIIIGLIFLFLFLILTLLAASVGLPNFANSAGACPDTVQAAEWTCASNPISPLAQDTGAEGTCGTFGCSNAKLPRIFCDTNGNLFASCRNQLSEDPTITKCELFPT